MHVQWYDEVQEMLYSMTSKYSILINCISVTIQECVRKAVLSVERSMLFHHHFVKEITIPSIQLRDLLLLILSKAQWMVQSYMTPASGKSYFTQQTGSYQPRAAPSISKH